MSKLHRHYQAYRDSKPGVKSLDAKVGDHERIKKSATRCKRGSKIIQTYELVVNVNGTCITLIDERKCNVSIVVINCIFTK